MNTSIVIQSQLLVTKFYVPVASGPLISRPRLTALLAEGTEQFLLILDDYQVITDQQVHTTLSYLVEHLPVQLRIILSTRADPPLPLLQLRIRGRLLEVRTDQLRCIAAETRAFFKE